MATPCRRRRLVLAFAFALARLGVSLGRFDSVLTDRSCLDTFGSFAGVRARSTAMLLDPRA